MMQVPEGIPVDVTSNIATAPESKTAILNSKMSELQDARATLAALGQSVMLAQKSIQYWTPQLLSSNGNVRMDAVAKLFGQVMAVKRIMPQMSHQEHVIMRLEKETAALRVAIDTWPAQAGLVGGVGGFPGEQTPHFSRIIQRPLEITADEALGCLAHAIGEQHDGQTHNADQDEKRLDGESRVATEHDYQIGEQADDQKINPRQKNGNRTVKKCV